MGEFLVVHQFAEIDDTVVIPDTAVGITVSVDPAFRNKQEPNIVNVCYLEPITEARRG